MLDQLRSRPFLLPLLALIFYLVGWVGMVFYDAEAMAKLTPFNLLVSLSLLAVSYEGRRADLLKFFALCFATGMVVEWIGIHTGLLFGNYIYGDALGWKLWQVPLLIGVNWFVTVYACGALLNGTQLSLPAKIALGAAAAVGLDYVIEQVAHLLDFWEWADEKIPLYNYVCWYLVSAALLYPFNRLFPTHQNKFAVFLLMLQWVFFFTLGFALS